MDFIAFGINRTRKGRIQKAAKTKKGTEEKKRITHNNKIDIGTSFAS